MLFTVLKSKILRPRITAAELYYEGSLTLDPVLMDRAGIVPYERLQVVNLNNGHRLETYVITGEEPGNGEVVLNGPAARLGYIGDEIIILSYAQMSPEDAAAHRPVVLHVDGDNQPIEK